MQQTITIQQAQVPALGFGTWQLNGPACRDSVAAALTLGYRHIDTAEMYGNEEFVGEGIRASGIPRHEVFLTTKIWYTNLAEKAVVQACEQSLKKLQTDYVDLLLIHWPNPAIALSETLGAMQTLQQQGKVKHMGVSNFPTTLLKEALQYGSIFCNQVEYHPFLSQQKLIDLCKANEILLTAYCPIAKGEVNDHPVLQKIAQTHGKTPVQVTLRWFMQQEVAAIPKASSAKHQQSNFNIFDFELSPAEMQAIFSLAQGKRLVNPTHAPAWDK
ncbi:aldo/keto reductase [Rhodocytophaga aerolata]|uniref:Aldo/keto reductase n=1 Tax=Rhodocytophaga aerolata TaxID=455078 RepID=A0ABT8RD17_9BACT|nr:aldo/keto reductase [Rhodocytophaga aerolata]MDO1450003.1 aldo/keto reductase [Rhodocytophaga aerolata]